MPGSAQETSMANTVSEDEDDQTPPNGGYGWVCVFACFIINAFTFGLVSSYGIYLSHYLNHSTFPSAHPLDFAFIGGSQFAAGMLCSPLVTFSTRTYGTRPTLFFGVVMLSGGWIAASFAVATWHLYLSQGLMIGIGVGFLYIPSIAIVSQWFSAKRSLANGITAAGSGVGGAVFSLAAAKMIETISLQWSLRITGILVFVMTSLATALVRDRNKAIQPKQHPCDLRLLRRTDVVLLLIWAFCAVLGQITFQYSLPDFALSIGLSEAQAADVQILLNVGTAVGRPFIGSLSDRFGRVVVPGLLTLGCGVACFAVWIPAEGFGVTVLFALICGAIMGIFWTAIGPVCTEIVGLKELPSLLSLSWLVTVLPTLFSEVISLKLRREGARREYLYPQIFAGLSYIIGSMFLLELHRRQRRKGKEEFP